MKPYDQFNSIHLFVAGAAMAALTVLVSGDATARTLAEVKSLGVLSVAGVGGKGLKLPASVRSFDGSFVSDPGVLTRWLAG